MEFYLILQEIMKEMDLSIPDIARECGLSDGTIRSAIVRKQKNVSLEVAFKLSDGLGVSLERLNGMPERTPALEKKQEPTPGSEDGLSKEENLVLGAVRGLTPVQQGALVAFLKTMLEQDR